MIDMNLILELITAAAVAYLSYMKHNQLKIVSNSPLLPVAAEGSAHPPEQAPAAPSLKKKKVKQTTILTPLEEYEGIQKINVKAQLADCANRGVPFDMTPYGAGAILDTTTGDITYK